MKRLFIALLIIILPLSLHAWGITTFGSGAAAAGTACTGTAGNNATTDAAYDTSGVGQILLRSITITCTGTPTSINFRTKYDTGNVKFVIFSTDDAVPDSRLYISSGQSGSTSSSVYTVSDTSCNYELTSGTYGVGVIYSYLGRVYATSDTGGTAWQSAPGGSYDTPASTWDTETDEELSYDFEIWLDFDE